jgi:drug/metabolite transporter (DMT)-like permease
MCFALTNILLLKLHNTPPASRMVAMFGGGAVIGVLCAFLATTWGLATPLSADMSSWGLWVLGLTLAFLVSNLALQYGAARLSAHTTAMVMMSEVMFASVSSVSLGTAVLTWRISVGGGLIVLAAVLAALSMKATEQTHQA